MLWTSLTSLALIATSFAERLRPENVLYGPMGRPHTLIRKQVLSATPNPTPPKADKPCNHGPFTRACWKNGYSISTDFDEKWPTTGVVKKFNFEITNTTCAPDGTRRNCLLVNNQFPGPVIEADWGDTIEIVLRNSMLHNGTGLHFHGIRQLNTVTQDGAPGLTECPLAPGDTKIYRFQATQYGSSWYHSHYGIQAGDGIVGPMVIHGPATANYDIDLGAFPVTDWYSQQTIWQMNARANISLQAGRGPPPADNLLIRGKNTNGAGGGEIDRLTLTPGKKHRLRIINTSIETSLRVALEGHTVQVIASDFVPVKPFFADTLLLGIGQRYDVIITANQTAGNYWFRAESVRACASNSLRNARSIFTYSGTPVAEPTNNGTAFPADCNEFHRELAPWWPTTIPSADFVSQAKVLPVDLAIPGVGTNNQNIVAWTVNTTAIRVDWREPSLKYVVENRKDFPQTYNIIEIPNQGLWTFWIIQEPTESPVKIPHPIHLHGHDFWVLGQGTGIFDLKRNVSTLQFVNPPRRDVTFLPANGWVVISFLTDNPGAWLLHCHIGSHISAGLGLQFIESRDKIQTPDAGWQQTCQNWVKYYNDDDLVYEQDDSGL